MPLTALAVKNAKPGRHSDGQGLYLLVQPSSSRSWVLRVQRDGKRTDYGLGSSLSLAQARDKAARWRQTAKEGKDPRAEDRKANATVPTFAEAARRCHADLADGWKSGKHSNQWITTLQQYAYPKLGAQPVDAIDGPMILSVLHPIWLRIPETARRVKQRIKTVLDYSWAHSWRNAEAPVGAIANGLPKQPKRNGHFAAMPYTDIAKFFALFSSQPESMGRFALQFTILTAARSGETRSATLGEIDLSARLWVIPAERMKAGVVHTVPLSEGAIAILDRATAMSATDQHDFAFPGMGGRPMSDATMSKTLREAAGRGFTVHGFRSSFRDWAAECSEQPGEVAEAALAHTIPNKVEAAYRRTDFLEKRKRLMAEWGAYCLGES